jgi:hypothetical protein
LQKPLSRSRSADLDWLAGILAAPPVKAVVGRPGSVAAASARETFGVLPTAARPHVVVPLASRRAAAQALSGASYTRGIHLRLARALLRLGVRTGVAQQLFRDRLSISDRDLEEDALPHLLLTHRLMEILGRRDIAVAVHLGPPRPNRKPLVQVLSAAGDVLGYAKIGWNPLTRELVRHEADVLTELREATRRFAAFEVPRVLHAGDWREFELLVLSPLGGRPFRTTRRQIDLTATAINEIWRLFTVDEMPLAESDFWFTERARTRAADDGGRLAHLADLVEARYGEEVLSFGSWHGDWAPWNMAWREGSVAIWDWERSSHSAPVGLDAAHFDFQVALAASRHRSIPALRQALRPDTPMLSLLALPRERRRLLFSLHLLEMALRWEEGRRAGMSPPDSLYAPALAALLAEAPAPRAPSTA